MSLFKKIGRGIEKLGKGALKVGAIANQIPGGNVLSKFVPGLNVLSTASMAYGAYKGLTAKAPVQMGGGVGAGGGGMVMAGGLPSFPGGGALIKTGGAGALVAQRAAPIVAQGAKALLPKVSKRVASALGWISVGGLIYDAAGNLQGRAPSRSMNPLNPRAAKRAIRRVRAVRKLSQKIESSLPKQRKSCR